MKNTHFPLFKTTGFEPKTLKHHQGRVNKNNSHFLFNSDHFLVQIWDEIVTKMGSNLGSKTGCENGGAKIAPWRFDTDQACTKYVPGLQQVCTRTEFGQVCGLPNSKLKLFRRTKF